MKDRPHWSLLVTMLSSTMQQFLEEALDAEYFDVTTIYKRFIDEPLLMDHKHWQFIEIWKGEEEPHINAMKLRVILMELSRLTSVEELKTSSPFQDAFDDAPFMAYFWMYLFWRVGGPEEVCRSSMLEEMLERMLDDLSSDRANRFMTRVRVDHPKTGVHWTTDQPEDTPPVDSKTPGIPLISYLLQHLDRSFTNYRYERANVRDGKPQARAYVQ